MGYYSEVAFVAKKKDWDKFVMEQKLKNSLSVLIVSKFWKHDGKFGIVDYDGEDYVVAMKHYCKWYEDSGDVGEFMNWLRSLDVYEYARAGEEAGDVEYEENGDPPCWLGTHSSVTCEVF